MPARKLIALAGILLAVIGGAWLYAAKHDAGDRTLVGAWVEPVPGMPGRYQGFVLHAGGRAESIQMQTLRYRSWSADARTLTLTAVSIGNHHRSTHTLRYTYTFLPDGRLRLKDRQQIHIYQRR